MRIFLVTIFTIIFSVAKAQPSNDEYSNAIQLCPNILTSATTENSTVNGTTDFIYCFFPDATIWYKFTTDNDGGSVTVHFSNLVFNPDINMGQEIEAHIVSSNAACSVPANTLVSACGLGATDFTITSSIALCPNTTYYVQVNGSASGVGVTQPAQCDFEVTVSGDGVEQVTPVVSISAINTILCSGDSEIITSNVSVASDTLLFNWYYNNSLLISSSTAYTYDAANFSTSGYVKLIFESDDICTVRDTTDSIYFDVTLVSANAGPDKYIETGGQTQIDGTGDGVPTWTPTASLISSGSFTPIASPSQTTTYFLTVTNGSCVATDSVNVFVGEIITVFTSFTPNGDAINDTWVIRNSSSFENMEVWVYDRSGQEVFHATGYSDPSKFWDGTLRNNGKPLPASTYFYVIDLKEGDYELFKGTVTIIR